MKKYEIERDSITVPEKQSNTIRPGVVFDAVGDRFNEVVASFDNKADALKKLEEYSSTIKEYSTSYEVEEYYVIINEYDDDEPTEWTSGGDVVEYSTMTIRIVDENYNNLEIVDNMQDALRLEEKYNDEDVNVRIMFN